MNTYALPLFTIYSRAVVFDICLIHPFSRIEDHPRLSQIHLTTNTMASLHETQTTTTPDTTQAQKSPLDNSPDEEPIRGRKRRRSSENSPPPQSSSSTNFRGRVRHRSVSVASTRSQAVGSPTSHLGPQPPGRKYQKKFMAREREELKQKRSQSPSRSKSVDGKEVPRRRQRTKSRSRIHRIDVDGDADIIEK